MQTPLATRSWTASPSSFAPLRAGCGLNRRAWRAVRGAAHTLLALLLASAAAPLLAQTAGTPPDTANPPPDSGESVPVLEVDLPAPPDANLPVIEPVITDEEFAERLPPIDPNDDPALVGELESIAEFERRLAAEEAQDAAPAAGADAPLGIPALADNDPVEEIGDAPVRDPELAAPLPALADFEVEPVEFAQDETDDEVVEVAYSVRVEGLAPADNTVEFDLRDRFDDLSALERGDGEAANLAQVTARLREDSVLMQRLLASQGWFDAQVDTRVDRSEAANGQPLTAVLSVVPGKRFTLGEIVIDAPPTVPPGLIADNLALVVGEPIIAERVQGAEAQVAIALPQTGYPFAEVGQRDILLDPDTGDGVYTLPVAVGPRSAFGGIRTTGDLAFDARHIDVLARFERGQLYDSRLVDDLRQALVATGLFSTVAVTAERTGENAGDGLEYATILVEQDAGPPRTLAASAGYGTGQGFRVEGSWTHRNLFPPEGALIATAVAGTREQGASVSFRRSNAGRRDRTVQAGLEALRSDFDAYEAFTGRLYGLVSYDSTPLWQKPVTYAFGAQLIGTNEQDFNPALGELARRTFFIGGLTGQLGLDTTDSLLDATRGFRVTALVEPEGSLQEGFTPYVRARVDGSAFFEPREGLVLAGRARLGVINGIDRFDLAPSRRFYAGGGGSVRGFGFQELGPRVELPNPRFDPANPDKDINPTVFRPIGGRSLVEAAAEVRYRFGNYGAVAFIDAGQVYESSAPGFDNIRFGVGIGGRFYTNFGPVRLDVATPLNRRRGESPVAVYVSIGQAF